jgi:Domain of unknown function (DUF3885)
VQLRSEIESVFEGKAFLRPLFYLYPAGLRFELSEGGSVINQFVLALRKAEGICADIFGTTDSFVTCLRFRAEVSRFAHRKLLSELRSAGIRVSRNRSIWLAPLPVENRFDQNVGEWWVNVAFEAPLSLVQSILWCAFAGELDSIRPRPQCQFYLFNIQDRVMVFPYDDRGMDVVGPNRQLLAKLYSSHRQHLLSHDLPVMQATFGAL